MHRHIDGGPDGTKRVRTGSGGVAQSVVLRMAPDEARAAHHALKTTITLMDEVGAIPPEAPLYGWRDRLAELARQLDHEINQGEITRFGRNVDRAVGFHPLGGASRGVGRCVCAAGPGTNPACEVHP